MHVDAAAVMRRTSRRTAPYLCRDASASVASGLMWSRLLVVGGACARLLVGVWCARAPGLISVHGPGWLRVGDMMVDGVIPQKALRPLGLSGPSTKQVAAGACGEPAAVHRCDEGLRAHARVQAGCSASSPSSRSVW